MFNKEEELRLFRGATDAWKELKIKPLRGGQIPDSPFPDPPQIGSYHRVPMAQVLETPFGVLEIADKQGIYEIGDYVSIPNHESIYMIYAKNPKTKTCSIKPLVLSNKTYALLGDLTTGEGVLEYLERINAKGEGDRRATEAVKRYIMNQIDIARRVYTLVKIRARHEDIEKVLEEFK